MSLQKLAICIHLDNILTDRQEKLTILEREFKDEFQKVAASAEFPEVRGSHNEYKVTYSNNFRSFYKMLKRVLAEYSLLAPDCINIKFQDVPAIIGVIEKFDTSYHRLCRPHSNPIPTL